MTNSLFLKNRFGGEHWEFICSKSKNFHRELQLMSLSKQFFDLFLEANKVSIVPSSDFSCLHNTEDCALLFEFSGGFWKKFWFFEGQQVNVSSQEEFLRWIKLRAFE